MPTPPPPDDAGPGAPSGGDAQVGRVVDGRYRILGHVADGGMASVWRALDLRLEREVAVKILRPGLAQDAVFAHRFRQEALAAARLNDPRVVAVYDQGTDGADLFLVMELVPGRTLRDVVHEDAPVAPRAALDIVLAVAEALGVAHRASLLHGDIKPENVIIREDGQVKVADFGLARAITGATATAVGAESILGTVSYLAPEQVETGRNDARSDVYATGIVLFELLTGRKPYIGESPIHVAYQHVHGQVPAPSSIVATIPAEVDALVRTVTAKDPGERPADGRALAALLREGSARLDEARRSAPVTTEPTALLPVGPHAAGRPAAGRRPEPTREIDPGAPAPSGATRRSPAVTTAAAAPPPEEPARPRRRRWALLLLPLLLAAVLLPGWWFLAGPGATTTVPDVAHQSLAAATARLDEAHLAATTTEAFSESVPKGSILSVSPVSGTTLHRGDEVGLTVSKGPERYTVPTLRGRTLDAARKALSGAHLTAGGVRKLWDEQVPAGQVLGSDPAAGTSLKPQAAVRLDVSLGRQPIDVPSVVGRTQEAAEQRLRDAGLRPAVADTRVTSSTVPEGSVVRQKPSTGTRYRGDTVTLTLSKGPEMVDVPDVIGRSLADARSALTAAGFTVKVERYFGGILDTVRFQSVDPGRQAPKGSTITVTVV